MQKVSLHFLQYLLFLPNPKSPRLLLQFLRSNKMSNGVAGTPDLLTGRQPTEVSILRSLGVRLQVPHPGRDTVCHLLALRLLVTFRNT